MASIRTTNIGDVLTIKKISQIHGFHPARLHLTNYHPDSPYAMTKDANMILNVNDQLPVIGKGKAQTKYREGYVTVTYNQYTFDIMATDLRRFCN